MDDRYLSLPYRYGYVGHNDPARPYDTARAGGNRAGRVTNRYQRFDVTNPAAEPESTFFVGTVQSLQESWLRAAQGQHGRGRWLPHGHREQLRRDGVGARTSSMRSAWKRAPSPS